MAAVRWGTAYENVWDPVVRAFVSRRSAASGDTRSERLTNEGGAWILSWDGWPIPFAVILDVLPTVCIVPSMHSIETVARDLREIVWFHARNAGLRVRMNDQVLEDVDVWCATPEAEPWYERLRDRWRPHTARIVVISDAVPDPRGPRHHMYAEPVTRGDGMFRSLVEACYGTKPPSAGEPKADWLRLLYDDGVYVTDLISKPLVLIDELEGERARRASLCAREVAALDPQGVVVCGEPTFVCLFDSGLPIINQAPVSCPTDHRREPFRTAVKERRWWRANGRPQSRSDKEKRACSRNSRLPR